MEDGAMSSKPVLQELICIVTFTKQLATLGVVVKVSQGKLFGPYTQMTSTFIGQTPGAVGAAGAKVEDPTGAIVVAGTGMTLGGATGANVGVEVGVTTGATGIVVAGTGMTLGGATGDKVGVTTGATGIIVGAATGDPAGEIATFKVSYALQSGEPVAVFTPTVATIKY